MSNNAPPGGGPGATVVASTVPGQSAAPTRIDPPAPQPQAPVTPPAPQAPAPQAPVPQGDHDPNALNLDPAPQTPAPEPSEPLPEFDDPGLNVAVDHFVNKLGLSLDSKELQAAAAGDFRLLEAKLEVLGDKAKGSERYVQLAKDAVARVQQHERSKHNATVEAVHAAVGGKENWTAIQSWARSNLTPDKLAEAKAALNLGGLAATAVAKLLHEQAAASPGVSVTGAETRNTDSPHIPITRKPPLSPVEYRKEYNALVKRLGWRAAQESSELRELNARFTHQ